MMGPYQNHPQVLEGCNPYERSLLGEPARCEGFLSEPQINEHHSFITKEGEYILNHENIKRYQHFLINDHYKLLVKEYGRKIDQRPFSKCNVIDDISDMEVFATHLKEFSQNYNRLKRDKILMIDNPSMMNMSIKLYLKNAIANLERFFNNSYNLDNITMGILSIIDNDLKFRYSVALAIDGESEKKE